MQGNQRVLPDRSNLNPVKEGIIYPLYVRIKTPGLVIAPDSDNLYQNLNFACCMPADEWAASISKKFTPDFYFPPNL